MSHFTVLVVGENAEEQLQPFHEFECTGTDDRYVQDVDVTDEARAVFEKRTYSPVWLTKDSLHDFFDEKEVVVPAREAMSFAEFVEGEYGVSATYAPDTAGKHKYGYALLDTNGEVTKVIDRTNPNAKWDWYTLGGRWTGFFKMKRGYAPVLGRKGIQTDDPRPGYGDTAIKDHIDFEGTEADWVAKEIPRFERAHALVTQHGIPPTWVSVRGSAPNIEEARRIYHAHPAVEALCLAYLLPWSNELHDEFCGFDREAFINMTRVRAWSPYAMIIDGQWFGRGDMGWFGVSSNETTERDWHGRVRKMVLALPGTTRLSIYDCHI